MVSGLDRNPPRGGAPTVRQRPRGRLPGHVVGPAFIQPSGVLRSPPGRAPPPRGGVGTADGRTPGPLPPRPSRDDRERGRRPRGLLARSLSRGGAPVAGRGRCPGAGRRCLAVAVSQARRALGGPVLEATERTFALVLRPGDTIDAEAFEHAVEAACRAGDREALAGA